MAAAPARHPAEDPADPFSAALDSRDRDVPRLVREALAHDRARLALQPVKAREDGRVVFHEALIRLTDPSGVILPAAQFVPHVETTLLGRELDCTGLKLGLAHLEAHPGARISINMSARSIADGTWRRMLDDWLRTHADDGPRLILEMTEASAMLLPEITVRFMAEMQPRGVCFALDDFGSGEIAFRHLKDFFFDLAKIDKALAPGIDTDPDNQAIAEALIGVARQFEMFTVAQGVERQGEADLYKGLGVDCLQGYLIGRPGFRA